MKKILSILVVPILAVMLYWFFYTFNNALKGDKENEIIVDYETSQEKLNIEDYIVGVIACEMPALYEDEALKAQAIASRTYAAYLLEHNKNTVLTDTTDQCYFNEEKRREKWGRDYEKYNEKLKKIVDETKNLVMKKDNELFKSFYFSTSNGYTEDSMTVFKEGTLSSVSSPWDKEAKNYLVTTNFTKTELEQKLGSFNTIKITSRDEHNHVEKVLVDDQEYSGIAFRKKLSLRSTDFDIEIKNNIYVITTRGYGHGVGMSQNGANYMAKEGHNYEDILKYYYKDITIVNY